MIKLYTELSFFDPSLRLSPCLSPYANLFGLDLPKNYNLESYAKTAHTYFLLVDNPQDCDFFVASNYYTDAKDNALALQFIEKARGMGKPVILFYESDNAQYLPISYSKLIIFRTSLYKSKRLKNEFPFAPHVEDVNSYCSFFIRPKTLKPTIGFCGNVDNNSCVKNIFKKVIKKMSYRLMVYPKIYAILKFFKIEITKHPGRRLRTQLINLFRKDKRFIPNFIIRDYFFNGVDLPNIKDKEIKRKQSRLEFFKNILESDYVLCPRGGGNFSFRFFEVLSAGRIPIVVDTDLYLPYSEWIDWSKYCVIIPENHVYKAGDIVYEFHKNISPEGFTALQSSCRKIWEQWLSPDGFFKNIYRYLDYSIHR